MALILNDTFDEIILEMSKNKKLMDLMYLPTVFEKDSEEIKNQKLYQAIRQCITKTSQNPEVLGEKLEPITIDNIEYKDYGKIRITIISSQGSKNYNTQFGNQRIDIFIYYNNTTDTERAFKILDIISGMLSNKELKINWIDDEENKCTAIRNLEPGFLLTQSPIINTYERIGMRFYFYNSYYN